MRAKYLANRNIILKRLYLIIFYVVTFLTSSIFILQADTTEQAINYFNTSLGENPLNKLNDSIEFSADNITFNSKLNLIIATGNIVIVQGPQIIKADKAFIQKDKNYILAQGNIYIKDAGTKEIFGDEIEIKNSLSDAVITNLKLLFADNSLLASNKIIKIGDLITTYDAAYTSCPFNKQCNPFWSIRAKKITYNKKTHTIKLYNGWLQIKQIPLIWIPYTSYSEPTIKRRFGLLLPNFGSSSVLGYYYTQPIFFPINDYTDLTLKLTLFQKKIPLIKSKSQSSNDTKALFEGIYSHNFPTAVLNFNGSYAQNNNNDWSIFSNFKKDINDTLRLKINFNNVSSRNFLTLHNLNGYTNKESFLSMNAALEAFLNENNFLQISLDSTKNLNNNISRINSPYVLPQINFKHFGNTHKYGKIDFHFQYDNFLTALLNFNTNGPDFSLQKLISSLNHSYRQPTKLGIFSFDTHIQSVNYYKAYLFDTANNKNVFDKYLGISLAGKVEFPVYSRWGSYNSIINPIAQISTANLLYDKIHDLSYLDNDNQEISVLNLFENNKYTGFDFYFKGNRFNYGLQWDLINNQGFSGQMLIGQSLYLNNNEKSNYMVYLSLQPTSYLKLSYISVINSNLKHFEQNNLNIFLGNHILGAYLKYRTLNNLDTKTFNVKSVEELQPSFYIKIFKNIHFSTVATFKLKNNYNTQLKTLKNLESLDAVLVWNNTCSSFAIKISRNFYGNTDVKSNSSIRFAFMLKNLGGNHMKFNNNYFLNIKTNEY